MTDVVTPPTDGDEQPTATVETLPATEGAEYAWAPPEPKQKKRRLGWWIGAPAGALVIGIGIASVILIAPGVAIAGVPVGGLTAGAAADTVSAKLAAATLTFDGSSGQVTVTGADLGATIDAQHLANEAYDQHPMWNVGSWNPEPVAAPIALDETKANAVLREVLPSSYLDAVNATVTFDAATGLYVTTPAEVGSGIDLAAVQNALASALAGDGTAALSSAPIDVAAAISTDSATGTADTLNELLSTVGFYVGDERTHPVDAVTAASWLTVTPEADGTFAIDADAAKIQTAVDSLAAEVNREPVPGQIIVNSDRQLLQTATEAVDGRALADTSALAKDAADLLSQGQGVIPLDVTVTTAPVTELFRRIDVNLSTQRVEAIENGVVVNSWWVSTGAGTNATHTGDFTVRAHVPLQDMGNLETVGYLTPNVPWVMYFNGDEAFHGTYWHTNFGTPMSHGCVNMTIDAAKWLYDWSPLGTQVSVHY